MKTAQIKSLAKYIAINILYAYSVYAGVVLGVEGWANVAKFMTIVTFVFSLLLFLTKDNAKVLESYLKSGDDRPPVPAWLDRTYDLAIVGVFVFYGWIGYATMSFLSLLFLITFKSAAKDHVYEALKAE